MVGWAGLGRVGQGDGQGWARVDVAGLGQGWARVDMTGLG